MFNSIILIKLTHISYPQFFGQDWRLPSSTLRYVGNTDQLLSSSMKVCPVWKRCNEVFGKVLIYRQPPSHSSSSRLLTDYQAAEPGLLFLGMKQGWDTIPAERMQKSPAIVILKQMDDILFKHLPRIERLAAAYKSYKLLKVSLYLAACPLPNVWKDANKPLVLYPCYQGGIRQSAGMAKTQVCSSSPQPPLFSSSSSSFSFLSSKKETQSQI